MTSYGERATFDGRSARAAGYAAGNDADLDIYQGDDYAAVVQVFNADGSIPDLTGVEMKSQIREKVADDEPAVLVEIACALMLPNVILLGIPHADTTKLGGVYVWDLQLTLTDGAIVTILAGAARARQEVTR